MARRQRILIADDASGLCWALSRVLRSAGFECVPAPDGATAMSIMTSHPCDLVLADIVMPGNEGLEFVSAMKRTWPELPVILMTGHPTLETAIGAVDLSVQGYLVKPFETGALIEKVSTAVRRGGRSQTAEWPTRGKPDLAKNQLSPKRVRRSNAPGSNASTPASPATSDDLVAPLVTNFLEYGLRRSSNETVSSYGTALTLFLRYLSELYDTPEGTVFIDQVTPDAIAGFVEHLRERRRCGATTCNARLSALRSFLRFCGVTVPVVSAKAEREPSRSGQRRDRCARALQSAAEVRAILEAPDLSTEDGRRDRALLLLLAETTMKTLEILSLKLEHFQDHYGEACLVVKRHGKKIRQPLSAHVAEAVREVCRDSCDRVTKSGSREHHAMFISSRGNRLTFDSARNILRRAVVKASAQIASLEGWRATVPGFRRSASSRHCRP